MVDSCSRVLLRKLLHSVHKLAAGNDIALDNKATQL